MTDVVARVASEGVSVGLAHCVPVVPAQPCRLVIAMIAASTANERLILSLIKWFLAGSAEVKRGKLHHSLKSPRLLHRLDSCYPHHCKRELQHRVSGSNARAKITAGCSVVPVVLLFSHKAESLPNALASGSLGLLISSG